MPVHTCLACMLGDIFLRQGRHLPLTFRLHLEAGSFSLTPPPLAEERRGRQAFPPTSPSHQAWLRGNTQNTIHPPHTASLYYCAACLITKQREGGDRITGSLHGMVSCLPGRGMPWHWGCMPAKSWAAKAYSEQKAFRSSPACPSGGS